MTLSSVIEAFFGIRFTPVQNDGNFSKAADDYKRSLSKLVQNGAPKRMKISTGMMKSNAPLIILICLMIAFSAYVKSWSLLYTLLAASVSLKS